MIKIVKIGEYITLSHVNVLFDHMLVNSLVYTNLLSIIKKHGEIIKFLVPNFLSIIKKMVK